MGLDNASSDEEAGEPGEPTGQAVNSVETAEVAADGATGEKTVKVKGGAEAGRR